MRLACLFMVIELTACGSIEKSASNNSASTIASNALVWTDGQNWLPYNLPGKKRTLFSKSMVDGRNAVRADAQSSVSMLRHQVRIPADQLRTLNFSWKVPALINNADMTAREGDDSPVRMVLAFEGDRSTWSTKNAMLSELTRAITGEELPYATLMYVWCNQCNTGSVIYNPRTDRIRKIAIESGVNNLNQWRDYERNIKADFERAFGEAPGALLGIALMTDTDNTQSQVKAYYGPVSWTAEAASASR
jgi:Protein of unknown function (DUF3047)